MVLWFNLIVLFSIAARITLCTGTLSSSSFPRTTVINLPHRSADRREKVALELADKNIPFFWMDAVDGKKLADDSPADFSRNSTLLGRWFMTPGMIGCFLSHRRCWEECANSNEPLLIFEDDVVLAPRCRPSTSRKSSTNTTNSNNDEESRNDEFIFRDLVMEAMDRLDCTEEDWDVLLLGALGCVHPEKNYGCWNWIQSLVGGKWRKTRHVTFLAESRSDTDAHVHTHENEDEDDQTKQFEQHASDSSRSNNSPLPSIHTPACPYGMHAYILSSRGAKKLLKECPRASFHVDVVAWGIRDLKMFAIHPLMAWQTHTDTTIGGCDHSWKAIIPTFIVDEYTGTEMGWALSSPLFRVGGNMWGGRILLTNGLSLAFMMTGLVLSFLRNSRWMLSATLLYTGIVTSIVRFLCSEGNR